MVSINPDVNIYAEFGRFTAFLKKLGNEDIVILGFDSMDSRLEAAVAALKDGNKPLAIIDGRMGAEEYQQYTIANPTLGKYKTTWYSDKDAVDEPCNAKATSYCSNMSGAFIANAVKKLINGEEIAKEIVFTFPGLVLGSK